MKVDLQGTRVGDGFPLLKSFRSPDRKQTHKVVVQQRTSEKKRQRDNAYKQKMEKYVAQMNNLKTSETYGVGVEMSPAKRPMEKENGAKSCNLE